MRRLATQFNSYVLTLLLVAAAFASHAQTTAPVPTATSEPRDVSYCELSRNPAAFNHQLVRVTGFVTHGFEDFQFSEPPCPTQGFSIWIMYGGRAESGTVYCCPGEGGHKTRSEPLRIEGVHLPLSEDANFRRFRALIEKEHDTTIHATLVGTFFSGEKRESNGYTFWAGMGHMGCCSLLVIQRIVSFQGHTRKDLDYSAEAGSNVNVDCESGTERSIRGVSAAYGEDRDAQTIEQQQNADQGKSAWAFKDPERVALDALKSHYPDQNLDLHIIKDTPTRKVYRWKHSDHEVTVVVLRPYWLAFYATSESVVWVATTIKEADCGTE
jgi:hypothetical protein